MDFSSPKHQRKTLIFLLEKVVLYFRRELESAKLKKNYIFLIFQKINLSYFSHLILNLYI